MWHMHDLLDKNFTLRIDSEQRYFPWIGNKIYLASTFNTWRVIDKECRVLYWMPLSFLDHQFFNFNRIWMRSVQSRFQVRSFGRRFFRGLSKLGFFDNISWWGVKFNPVNMVSHQKFKPVSMLQQHLFIFGNWFAICTRVIIANLFDAQHVFAVVGNCYHWKIRGKSKMIYCFRSDDDLIEEMLSFSKDSLLRRKRGSKKGKMSCRKTNPINYLLPRF